MAARGEEPPEEWSPELHLGISGRIPADYIPEAEVRINLYARIAGDSAADGELKAEIEDRFGPMPEELSNLIALIRLKRRCREAGIARIDAGPQAIALTFKERRLGEAALRGAPAQYPLEWRGERLVLPQPIEDSDRLGSIETLVEAIGPG
jgi:transcription-repair coupling factor (superfamily II helicase)